MNSGYVKIYQNILGRWVQMGERIMGEAEMTSQVFLYLSALMEKLLQLEPHITIHLMAQIQDMSESINLLLVNGNKLGKI